MQRNAETLPTNIRMKEIHSQLAIWAVSLSNPKWKLSQSQQASRGRPWKDFFFLLEWSKLMVLMMTNIGASVYYGNSQSMAPRHTFRKLFQLCAGHGVLRNNFQMRYTSKQNHYCECGQLEADWYVLKECSRVACWCFAWRQFLVLMYCVFMYHWFSLAYGSIHGDFGVIKYLNLWYALMSLPCQYYKDKSFEIHVCTSFHFVIL